MEQPDIALFIGRFHPLLVHLPIGFLLLAILLEFATLMPKLKFTVSDAVLRFCLLFSWLASMAAIGLGLLLADAGGYGGDVLWWHKWLGIGLGVVSFFYWIVKQFRVTTPQNFKLVLPVLILLLLGGTGHFGGSLTHGEEYLTAYAPVFVQRALGTDKRSMLLQSMPSPDSAVLFADLVHLIIKKRCISCHNNEQQSGGLNLMSREGIAAGGDNGQIIDTAKPLHSELFVRVTLPPSSRKFMPPSGEPLSFAEIKILQWWLERDASFDEPLLVESVPEDIQELLLRDFGYDMRPKPYLETISVSPLDSIALKTLDAAGFSLTMLSNSSNFLHVKAKSTFRPDQKSLQALLLAKEQIAWLDLSSCGIQNDELETISQLTNLTRLRIHENPLSDVGMTHLKGLQHLESINLYHTQITGDALKILSEIPTLTRIYAWQTKITKEDVEVFSIDRPKILIDLGVDPST